jgi:antitoxin component YwqK of YwqJK toxin-antitoxin module
MMRAILLLSLALLPAAVSLTQEKDTPKAEAGGVPYKNLGWDSARGLFTYPFTGVATEQYKNGQMKLRYHIKDGKYDGLVEEWYENGKQKTKTNYEGGKHQGDNFYWNADGTLQAHKVWKDDVLVTEHAEKKP